MFAEDVEKHARLNGRVLFIFGKSHRCCGTPPCHS